MSILDVRDPQCKLQRLYLSRSDIDDRECASFMESLHRNKSLEYLDLSHNRIGEMEEYNTVNPDFITGGESIAEMLLHNNTYLRNLFKSRLPSHWTLGYSIWICRGTTLEKKAPRHWRIYSRIIITWRLWISLITTSATWLDNTSDSLWGQTRRWQTWIFRITIYSLTE